MRGLSRIALGGDRFPSNPCIIAATNCQQPAGFPYNNFVASGGDPSYDELSPVYTVGQLSANNLTAFDIAIDVNTTSAASETLNLFEVIIGGQVAYVYDDNGIIGSVSNNGNGYADWTLQSVDLSGLAADTTVQFHAVWSNAVDGGESFFLVSTTPDTPVPEPSSLLIFGSALLGLAWVAHRRRRNV